MSASACGGLEPAYVLHRRPYSNSSLLVELFGPQSGRVVAVARGAQRGASAGMLQPFRPLLVQVAGKGEVKTLAAAEARGRAFALAGRRLYCGLYLNELLLRLVGREDPCLELFAAYGAALSELSGEGEEDQVLRRFEVRLLQALGFGLLLDREPESGAAVQPERWYAYRVEHGPSAVADPHGAPIRGRTLLALAAGGSLTGDGRREARDLMRRILDHHLGGRPLKSRELFRNPLQRKP